MSVIAGANTTLDPPTGVCLYLRGHDGGYLVTDLIGLRYGWGKTILHALEMWAQDVEGVMSETKAGGALAREQGSYRAALTRPEART